MAIIYSKDLFDWDENVKACGKTNDGIHVTVGITKCSGNEYASFIVPLSLAREISTTGYIAVRYSEVYGNFYFKESVSSKGYKVNNQQSKSAVYFKVKLSKLHIAPEAADSIKGKYRVERCDTDVFGAEKIGE